MNTDNILQKGGWERLRQTVWEEREADVLSDHLLVRLWDYQ
jgi:endonuclease/exonuclease/phosphatase family metal-dependent hydrolase